MKQITTPSLKNTARGHVGTFPFPSLSGSKKIVSETKGSDLTVPPQMRRFLAQHQLVMMVSNVLNNASSGKEDTQYHVTGLSVEDGTLMVSNVLNNASSGKEVIIAQANERGGVYLYGPVEDQFDFSMEYDIVIRWAVTNSSCEQAMHRRSSNYACRSVNSDCQNVTHGKIFMGYRCKCSSGYSGNPYIQDGCTGIYLSSFSMCYSSTIVHT